MYLTVLLWDKDKVSIETKDDIESILYKSREKCVVLTDDQYEISRTYSKASPEAKNGLYLATSLSVDIFIELNLLQVT